MDREREIKYLFDRVWDCAPEEWARLLVKLCPDDEALRDEVMSLLRAQSEAGDFLETPPFISGVDEEELIRPDFSGRRIGKYELQRVIGRGGMAMVYLAVRIDDEFSQQAALKLIQSNADTEDVIRRFKQERQILADLNHPNIARLLDGGTTDEGQPYLVMEYIDGMPITEYCDRRQLSIAERLHLFRAVCDAVQYAHRSLVIHRDIKPGNVLVTAGGAPKLLDFGIAKVLKPGYQANPQTLTRSGLYPMTPEYASPEQIRGEEISTASDVYSLGGLLYELLTGQRPYQLNHLLLHEVALAICEQEPETPSSKVLKPDGAVPRRFPEGDPGKLARRLKGDLDNITLMALRKEPTRRYSTVEQFSADIERHLSHQPVIAHRPTLKYSAGKFVQRNKSGVMMFFAIVLAIIAGLLVAVRQAYVEQERAQRERRLRYAGDMQQAMRDWEAGNLPRLLETLGGYQPGPGQQEDWRGFEWYYLWRLSHREKMVLPGAGFGMVLSPDGRMLATGKVDGSIALWDLANGRQIALFKGHAEAAFYLAFSPDGRRLLTGGSDDTVKVWDVATRRHFATLKGHTADISSVAFSPDGNRILTGSYDHTSRLWDAVTYRELLVLREEGEPKNSQITSKFAPDGKTFAAMGYSQIRIRDAATGRLLSTIRNDEKLPEITTQPTGQKVIVRARGNKFESLRFSPDGRLLATTTDVLIKVWNPSTGRKVTTLSGHTEALNGDESLAFSPDGRLLASGGNDRTIKLWNTTGWRERVTIKGIGTEVNRLAFSPDGRTLVSGCANQAIKFWDVEAWLEPTVLDAVTDKVFGAAFAGEGRLVATGENDGKVKVWDVTTGAVRNLAGHRGSVCAVAASPDGRLVATASYDRTVKLWEVTTGQAIAVLEGHYDHVRAVTFSSDGRRVATGSDDQTARIWDVATGREIGKFNHPPPIGWSGVWAVAFSPDGKLLATGHQDGPAKLMDIAMRREVAVLAGQAGGIWETRFSPDGMLLATAAGDSTVKLWEVASRRELATLKGHAKEVFSLDFSPDGKRLATASDDRTVKLWDLETMQELISLEGRADPRNGHTDQVWSVAFSPDGNMLVSASWDRTARIWRAATKEEVEAHDRKQDQAHKIP